MPDSSADFQQTDVGQAKKRAKRHGKNLYRGISQRPWEKWAAEIGDPKSTTLRAYAKKEPRQPQMTTYRTKQCIDPFRRLHLCKGAIRNWRELRSSPSETLGSVKRCRRSRGFGPALDLDLRRDKAARDFCLEENGVEKSGARIMESLWR
ncbi:uncharacterized protein LOC120003599 [Tripterygium wilfordii]|uniref:uncharacterized protein LOC120003599 n=1 Tax=Tripterygium wilfordii TaxID=458696 RepID=UPI0018F8458D|nr:uncharacterized protein LOC120003599 [Tripterygium wilfordii]